MTARIKEIKFTKPISANKCGNEKVNGKLQKIIMAKLLIISVIKKLT
jgi:hypothetical protein